MTRPSAKMSDDLMIGDPPEVEVRAQGGLKEREGCQWRVSDQLGEDNQRY